MNCSISDQSSKYKLELVPPQYSGVEFRNTVTSTPEQNILNFLYFYNGGGVAIGDLNGDNLPDIYFTANQHSNALYLNRGNMKFEDITAIAGVGGPLEWATGVTIVDINADGKLDIYVSYVSHGNGINQLYINQGTNKDGIPYFHEEGEKYGLNLSGFSTQAAFFDYDLDGDLDMYMLNHSTHETDTYVKSVERKNTHPVGDKFFRNEKGKFIEVSSQVGIYSSKLGYGLGIAISDIDHNGYPDIYIGNDFHEDDYLYMNQGDGTFIEKLGEMLRHTSRFSMGNDIADFNNDLRPDILSLDMLPSDPIALKASVAEDKYDIYHFKLSYGYKYQYARNTLQLNRGGGMFSDIGLLASVEATDWSWAGLWMDIDNDRKKDIFVSNGILHRPNDKDYIDYVSSDVIQYQVLEKIEEKDLLLIKRMPKVYIPNVFFQNQGNFQFENVSNSWSSGISSYSSGAAYGDLDNDGDLDLVVNNSQAPAFIYRNRTIEQRDKQKGHHYLRFTFEGDGGNTYGVGTKVVVFTKNEKQYFENYHTRGFQSSMDVRLHIGLGSFNQADSVYIIWSNDNYEVVYDVEADKEYHFKQSNAEKKFLSNQIFNQDSEENRWFEDITDKMDLNYTHEENTFIEFHREPLIPHMNSAEGPAMAIGDLNNDNHQDLFVGGGKWQKAHLWYQEEKKMKAQLQDIFENDELNEDVDAHIFDADKDGDNDLLVISGGNEFDKKHKAMQPRLYLHQDDGSWLVRDLPVVEHTSSVAAISDYDQDGDEDIFLGSIAVPWNYGQLPTHYLLRNNGKGHFEIDSQTKKMIDIGFIKDAIWVDINGDERKDLIMVGHWMPVTIFMNQPNGILTPMKQANHSLAPYVGWWNSITSSDVNNDGRPDLIVGNLGYNSKYKASMEEPVTMYVGNFDQQNDIDQIITHYIQGKEHIFSRRDEIVSELEYVKKKYPSHFGFAKAELYDIVDREKIKNAQKFRSTWFSSTIFYNQGESGFFASPLPIEAQFSPIQDILVRDLNGDGLQDMIIGSNQYEVNLQRGRYDAGYGLVLLGMPNRLFQAISSVDSGLKIRGQVRKMDWLRFNNELLLMIAINDEPLQIFKLRQAQEE